MIQLEQQQHEEFVCGGVVVVWLTPTTYIQLAGAGSKIQTYATLIKVILTLFCLCLKYKHGKNVMT